MAAIEELEPDGTDFRLDVPLISTPRLVLRRPDKDDAAGGRVGQAARRGDQRNVGIAER